LSSFFQGSETVSIFWRRAGVAVWFTVFACTFALAQSDPQALVSQMVDNELHAQKTWHYWMYVDSNTKPHRSEVKRLLETSQCWLSWPISINGQPPSPQQEQQARAHLQQLVNNPNVREKNRKELNQDAHKANTLMQILPAAFLFTPEGEQNGSIKLAFRPNPHYRPPSDEAKVFHHMAGTLLINAKETRLAGISGKLTSNVEFGWGILGKIRKGGTFSVAQSEVAPGDWEVTRLDVHISGRALFFHTISEQQSEVKTGFQPVPRHITLAHAAATVQHPPPQPAPPGLSQPLGPRPATRPAGR
jgi:hypothetical protein